LVGRWTHSFEEDHDGVTVYRHDDFAFPPARGRRGVEFRPDGSFSELLIGRGDAPEPGAAGRWSAGGEVSRAVDPAGSGGMAGSAGMNGGTGSIVSVGPDRLEIDWKE
jgi:hypothetical protein